MVIMPSIPILITPLLSEKQEPRAARRRGGVAIKVALIKRPRFLMITSILVCLLLCSELLKQDTEDLGNGNKEDHTAHDNVYHL